MQRMIARLSLFILIVFSPSVFADKILLTGRPVVLFPTMNYYSFPSAYVSSHNYHFVNVSGDNRVCFINAQPSLKSLDLLRITIAQNNKKFLWYCYRYDPRYFVVEF
ncbi:hypothetical protein Lnau_1486 [Legionella nautarum]|uniref:Uncharacterized protein n=1 Tax=Legionella nautarum TaxID=45070 RepID=A0A0W0WWA4_9GAMM|nr:hypothetical protein [Legionella nautarum]KTD36502.1 hypothetical protein Lnau_1486 [Legionella nautarum]